MHGCMSSMFQNQESVLCAPLEQLKHEHILLNQQKREMFELAEKVINNHEQAELSYQVQQLVGDVIAFKEKLDPHSDKEEGVLFSMMAKYIGRDSGPIAVMEYEHDQAKNHLSAFLKKSTNLEVGITVKEANELASHVVEAYHILTDHFSKEENVLFPMAEQMLTAEEKEAISLKIGTEI